METVLVSREMFRKKIYYLFLSLFLCLGIAFGNTEVLKAEETSEVSEADILEGIKSHRDSIVRIESICWDGETEIYEVKSFSGFVVSDSTAGIHIATIYHDLTYSSEEIEAIKTKYNLEDNVRISETIEVVFSGDLRVAASIIGQSEQRNLSVLKLNQNINFENALQFAPESNFDGKRVFLLSYPESADSENANYNIENVVISSGTVLSSYLEDEILFQKHDIQTDAGSVGGPLLDEKGHVAGLLLSARAEEDGTAISSEALKAFLSTFNVSFQEYEEIVEEKKLPVLNIILGAVILVLLVLVITQVFKTKGNKEKLPDKYTARTVLEEEKVSGRSRNVVRAQLEYPAEKQIVVIRKASLVIGRDPYADFILASSTGISRKHACIEFDKTDFYITDLKSTNHTYLNGLELTPGEKRRLSNGDEILIGKERLIFRKSS